MVTFAFVKMISAYLIHTEFKREYEILYQGGDSLYPLSPRMTNNSPRLFDGLLSDNNY